MRANNLVYGYNFDYVCWYDGLLWVRFKNKEGSVEECPTPVLHLAGKVDGDGARPGKLVYDHNLSKASVEGLRSSLRAGDSVADECTPWHGSL